MVDERPPPKADVAKKADNVAKKADDAIKTEAAPPKEANIYLEGNPDRKTVEETWVRGTTNAAMVTEPPIPTIKGAAPVKALIQLDMDAEPVEKTWIRGTTNAAMVTEPPIPKLTAGLVKESAKTLNDKKRVDVYPTKDASAQEENNVQLETNPFIEPVE